MVSPEPLWVFVVCANLLLPVGYVCGNSRDLCTGSKSVVKTMQSASIGARLVSRCIRRLALKYKLTPKALHKAIANSCLIAHICYTHVDQRKNLEDFRAGIIKCFTIVSKWVVVTRPEVLGEELSGQVTQMTADVANCVRSELPKDKEITLNVLRYLRTFFFTA